MPTYKHVWLLTILFIVCCVVAKNVTITNVSSTNIQDATYLVFLAHFAKQLLRATAELFYFMLVVNYDELVFSVCLHTFLMAETKQNKSVWNRYAQSASLP